MNQRLTAATSLSRRSLLVVAPTLLLTGRESAAAPISPLPHGIDIPDTPAGRELAWVIDQVNRMADGLSNRRVKAHVSPEYLSALPADELIEILRSYAGPAGPFTVVRFEGGVTNTRAYAIVVNPLGDVWRIRLSVSVDDPHLITELYFEPVNTPTLPMNPPTTWARLEQAIQNLAPRVSFAAAELTDSGPVWLGRVFGENQRAIASLFKIFVLGELVNQIAADRLDWTTPLPIDNSLRSLPSGNLRLAAAGTQFPVRTYAEQMISASDNTATDHLIAFLGRDNVQSAFALMGHHQPDRNVPLLLTREWFAMRLRLRDSQIQRYIDADEARRLRILENTVDPLASQLTEEEPWPGPRFIDQIEWFAGASDITRALAWLQSSGRSAAGAPALDALSLNPGICWHPGNWAYVGYKGGYETGVMSNAWLLQRQDGRWFAFAGIINDTRKEVDTAGFWSLLAVAERLLAYSA